MSNVNQNEKLASKVLKHMEAYYGRSQAQSILLTGAPGIGKEQSLTSKIKTPTGWTTMGEISVGDVISTPDGKNASVTGVFPQGEKQIYKITFSDDRTARVGAEHLWKVRKSRSTKWEVLTTLEIKSIIENTQYWMYIPTVNPEHKTPTELPIDPYIFGVLLGDGNLPLTKFIPEIYKNASIEQKEQLIAGLFDTDGYVSETGTFTAVSEQLAHDIQEIVRSLGGHATIKTRTPHLAYCVSIRYAGVGLDLRITKIEPDGVEQAQCIMVDHPDHLYITDNYVVTHNTTFAKIFGELVGMQVIIIEVPHITEEHMINIPFIVFNPETNSTQAGNLALQDKSGDAKSEKPQDYKLVLAQSNLYTQLINSQPVPDARYLQDLSKAPAYVQEMFKNLGGTATTVPAVLQGVRSKFKNILFLDEFFRSTTMRIRNILRGLLNHEIGMHRLPSSTYVMYASNMSDTGSTIEEVPTNYEFKQVQYQRASKEDWFKWLENQCKTKYNIQMNESIMKKFKKALKEEDLSYEDINAEVRTSPRRWEQILLYINSSLPVANRKEAQSLLTNIKNNFIHYKEGKYSDLHEKVLKAVTELIRETSNVELAPEDVMGEEDWKDQLDHMVQQQIKLGENRKHIPVVSGPPGIGKTTQAHDVAVKNNLRLITISCDNLQPDDVIGMPLPSNKVDVNSKSNDIKVQFSTPVLYQRIMSQIKQADEKYEQEIQKQNPKDAQKILDQYKRQKYKYLIFFDELNRVADERTFNGLRKVMLDKDFGPAGQEHGKPLELPKSAIVVGAINPSGTGTQELTHHFRDVVDFIPAQANWQEIRKWIRNQKTEDLNKISDQTKDAAMGLMDAFVEKFKSKEPSMSNKRAAFHLDIGGADVYMSPREYTGLYSSLCHDLNYSVHRLLRDPEITADKLRDGVDEAVFEAFEENLNFPFEKAKFESEEFMNTLKNWISTLPIETFSGLITTKLRHKDNLSSLLGKYLDGRDITHMPEDATVINLNNSMDNAEIIDQFRECLQEKLTGADQVKKYVVTEDQPKITMKGDTLQHDASAKVSVFTNVVLGLLYTLHINSYSNDRVAIIGKAANKAYGEVVEKLLKAGKIDEDLRDQAGEQVLALRSEISDLMSNL